MTDSYPTRLKQILETEGRTQTWLGRQLDPPITRSKVCEWAAGVAIPSQARREQIARALGRSVSDVFPQSERQEAA